ncbi:conserved hypothetical protein [Luminiphilus syltensis NOR5-1B]|uniref:Cytochrome c domain-containing protein n=1 Tax=Luminiphilus syltensis NOR5-1B TaxID=565045 RepID=B8KTR0_9GAMM|nr:c-type cytochrome [Luminiphilus syltensis]EED35581.1 conserved hypothetical protein [Luminiphilus syltensis NOR5-1B]
MNTNLFAAVFTVVIGSVIWVGMNQNDPSWSGNMNTCTGECYEQWKEAHGGGIAALETAKQAALAAASPEALGENYYTGCVACHGANGAGGIGPQLEGQPGDDIVAKLTAYRAGETRGGQSAMMWPVAKPMTDDDIQNLAAYITTL